MHNAGSPEIGYFCIRTATNIPSNNNSIIRLREYYTADIFLFLSYFFFTLIYFDIKKTEVMYSFTQYNSFCFLIFFFLNFFRQLSLQMLPTFLMFSSSYNKPGSAVSRLRSMPLGWRCTRMCSQSFRKVLQLRRFALPVRSYMPQTVPFHSAYSGWKYDILPASQV